MKMADFDLWTRDKLDFSECDSLDASMNGLQVGDSETEIEKIAFAVDACMDSFHRAAEEGAQALFVHHGLFWGPAVPLTGVMGERVRYLMEHGLSLYACHLPLDRHGELGNNAGILKTLGLNEIEPFGDYRGCKIGYKGQLSESSDLETLIIRLFGAWEGSINALRFGPSEISRIAVISGGGPREVSQAIDEGMDLYITGDSSHEIYHQCREAGINVLFAGHYLTEIFGVKSMAEIVASELGIKTVFLDIPTGY